MNAISRSEDIERKYGDILCLPHHQSKEHPHMTLSDRAAQFSPFAALTGYEDLIEETGRLTVNKIELDEDRIEEINARLILLQQHVDSRPEVEITYFKEDAVKDGGMYMTLRGSIRKIDRDSRHLIMTDGKHIPIKDIIDIGLEQK